MNNQTILRSGSYTDKVIGFADPTSVEITLDESGRISHEKLLPNKDMLFYLQIAIDGGLLKTWNGLTTRSAFFYLRK